MIVKKFETKDEWMEARKGKITGSRLKDIVVKRGIDEKIGFSLDSFILNNVFIYCWNKILYLFVLWLRYFVNIIPIITN